MEKSKFQKDINKWVITGFIYSLLILLAIANTLFTKKESFIVFFVFYSIIFIFVFLGNILLVNKKFKAGTIFWLIGGIISLPLGVLMIIGAMNIKKKLKEFNY
jgi:hypothetical protein